MQEILGLLIEQKRQQRAVDENMMREQHPSMPISQNKDTSISTGNKPKFDS